MRSRELAALAAALLVSASVGAGAGGCLHNPDPTPRSMAEVQSDAHGGYAVVKVGGQVHQGELIAIGPDGVWVLVGGSLVHTPLERASGIEVHPYDVSIAGVAGWGLLGTLSTITHGFFLVFTAPIWTLTAVLTGASHSRTALEEYDSHRDNWQDLAKWARFPQGLPAGVTATELFYGRSIVAPPGPPSSVEPIGPPAPGQPAPAPALPPTQLMPPPAQPQPQPQPAQPAQPQPQPAQPAPQPRSP
ncbi:MAG TPA: hypothetical protein VNO30_24615 [Kofleriaceae bacterium]|nr:hypothetical protein [Kofleriaceae bacterium]